MNILKTFLIAGAVTLIGGAAHARTISSVGDEYTAACLGSGGQTVSISLSAADDAACDGVSELVNEPFSKMTGGSSGGDLDNHDGPLDVFGMTWLVANDNDGNYQSGAPIDWDDAPESGDTSWSIIMDADWVGDILIEIKQDGIYALFDVDVAKACDFDANTCSGLWGSSGPGDFNDVLSHTSLWYKTTPIPLPAAGWLLLGGLGGLAAMKRRRKS